MSDDLKTEPPIEQLDPKRLAWRKNAVYIYRTLITITTTWPSLTIQWIPEVRNSDNAQELILGSRTGGQSPEYLRFGRMVIPRPELKSFDTFDSNTGTFDTHQSLKEGEFEITQRIDHLGEIYRAKFMPQNANIVATIGSVGQANVFDRTKFPLNPSGAIAPTLSLIGHEENGFGLDWSPVTEGVLVTSANDGKIIVWDLNTADPATESLGPAATLNSHVGPINDVKCHLVNGSLVLSCGDDGKIILWDWKTQSINKSCTLKDDVPFSIAFNSGNEYLLAVGTQKGQIYLYDTRTMAPIHTLHTLTPHTASITALEWNPRHPTVLASGSSDGTVSIWDVALIESGSEHKFRHLGHQAPVGDLSWNPAYDMVLGSVAEDNSLHVWEPEWAHN